MEVVRRGDDEVGGGGGVDGVGVWRWQTIQRSIGPRTCDVLQAVWAGDRTGGDHDSSFKMDRFTSGDPALFLTKM